MAQGTTARVTTVGIDIAKNGVGIHGVDAHGHVVVKKRLARQKVLPFLTQLPPCLIGMEASGGAHYWAREFTQLGHTVQLMSPQFVKPYVQSQTNDPNDAAGICEAVERPRMRGVPVKSITQQDVQALHRIRERQIKARTAFINQIRGRPWRLFPSPSAWGSGWLRPSIARWPCGPRSPCCSCCAPPWRPIERAFFWDTFRPAWPRSPLEP